MQPGVDAVGVRDMDQNQSGLISRKPDSSSRRPPWRCKQESHADWTARRHLRGVGLEIGALFVPKPTDPETRVFYLDRVPPDVHQRMYPDVNPGLFCPIDLVASGAPLNCIRESSLDFIIASHVLEHLPNPLSALDSWFDALKPRGHLLVAVPDKNHTSDRDRARTPLSHLVDHLESGAAQLEFDHYLEWARDVEKTSGSRTEQRARELMASRYPVHAHVWSHEDIEQWLDFMADRRGRSWKLMRLWRGPEIVILIKKLGPSDSNRDNFDFWMGLARDIILTDSVRSLPGAVIRRIRKRRCT